MRNFKDTEDFIKTLFAKDNTANVTMAGKVSVVYNKGRSLEELRDLAHGKGNSGGGHGGDGTWIFSYADLITILMMFFIILLSISNLSVEKFDELKKAMSSEDIKNHATSGEKRSTDKSVAVNAELQKLAGTSSPMLAGIPLDAIAKKAAGTGGDSFSQLTAGVRMMLESVNKKFIERESVKVAEFESLKSDFEKFSRIAAGRSGDAGMSGEIKLVLEPQEIFTQDNEISNTNSLELIKSIVSAVHKISPVPFLVIEVHTSKYYKDKYQNWTERTLLDAYKLTEEQSNKVLKQFLSMGIDPALVSIGAYGYLKPLGEEKNQYGKFNEAGIKANNRVVFYIKRRQEDLEVFNKDKEANQ